MSRNALRQWTEELFANYYGKPLLPKGKKATPATVMSLQCDHGEILPQRIKRKRHQEYVVAHSTDSAAVEEYVVAKASVREQGTGDRGQGNPSAMPTAPAPITPPSPPSAPSPPPAPMPPSSPSAPAHNQQGAGKEKQDNAGDRRQGTGNGTPNDSMPQRPNDPTPNAQRQTPNDLFGKEISEAKTTDDDFFADMEAILTGKKVFDSKSKKMMDRDLLGQAQSADYRQEEEQPPAGLSASSPTDNSQAIFDRIAQSMQYANAYDLGTVELENRFADFDKNLEKQAEAKKKPKPVPPTAAPSASDGKVGTGDFLQDLDAIKVQHDAEQARTMSVPPVYSRPFYDAGEHVMTGGDLYKDRLHVGKPPGVPFSYGQIIAMADLYESVADMMGVDAAELTEVKKLLEDSTRYYETKGAAGSDVSHKKWNDATKERYMRLALDNYEHFSPNLMLLGKAGISSPNKDRNHQVAWETHHRDALDEAARLFVTHPNQSIFPEKALIINAFGDHFLTDAFAAGHQINKAEMIQLFQQNFYLHGTTLHLAGERFFDNVAQKAWHGDVAAKFSKLETVETHYGFHPNISSASRFADVLKAVATQAADEAMNLALKALHDKLNKDGIEVFNNAGDGTWRLTGDGTLDAKNVAIIRKAVQQSINNVTEVADGQHISSTSTPAVLGVSKPEVNFVMLAERVWRHVPQLTPASQAKVQRLMRVYTDPASQTLIDEVAQLIHNQVDLLITKLIERKALREDK
jgi:hypothetical protein